MGFCSHCLSCVAALLCRTGWPISSRTRCRTTTSRSRSCSRQSTQLPLVLQAQFTSHSPTTAPSILWRKLVPISEMFDASDGLLNMCSEDPYKQHCNIFNYAPDIHAHINLVGSQKVRWFHRETRNSVMLSGSRWTHRCWNGLKQGRQCKHWMSCWWGACLNS